MNGTEQDAQCMPIGWMLCGSAYARPRTEERHDPDLRRPRCWQGWQWSRRRSAAEPLASSHNPRRRAAGPPSSVSPRRPPATPSWTRLSAPTSRTPARRSRSRRSGPAARAKASPTRSPTSRQATGITIQVDSIGSSHETVLKTRIEGGAPPDMAAAGAADRRARVRGRRQGHRPRHVHGCREAEGRLPVDHRPHERRRPHLEHPDQGRRQVDDLVPGEGLRGQGLHGSQDLGRARCPVRQDRRRR